MKARMIGNPYKTLKNNRSRLTGQQYQAMKGQIRNGNADDAMRGLQKLMDRISSEQSIHSKNFILRVKSI